MTRPLLQLYFCGKLACHRRAQNSRTYSYARVFARAGFAHFAHRSDLQKRSAAPFLFIACSFLLLSAFSLQPMDERKAQESLPMSQDPTWSALQKTKIIVDQKQGYYSAKFPPTVKSLSGKELTVSGFMMPLESKDKFKHFLLSKRTPTCPFCPPGEPNEILDVWTNDPVAYTDDMVKVKGTFALMNDKEMGLFFKLKSASVVK